MGNKHSNQQQRRPFTLGEWYFLYASEGRGLFRNRITGQHAEEFLLRTGEQHKLAYYRRSSRSEYYLVNVLHCEVLTNFDERYTLIDFTVRVFLEHVPVRLADIAELPADAVPLLLFDCLLGFKKICEEHGPICVTPHMIGFAENKELRVWLSSNFLDNVSEPNASVSEATMVEDIFTIFDRYSEEYINRPERMTFSQGLQFVAKLRVFDKNEIRLIKVAHEKTQVRIKQDLSPEPWRQRNTTSTTKQFRKEAETSKLSQASRRKKEENVWKESSATIPFMHSYLHQRKVSSNEYITSAYQEHTEQQMSAKSIIDRTSNHKSKLKIGLESARTTSNNVPIYNELIELDCNGLQLELLDEKKSKENKLRLIRDTLRDTRTDMPIRKICRIYDYALQYDPLIYRELQMVKGRISNISNQHVIRKLIELSEQQNEHYDHQALSQSESEPTWKMPKREIIPFLQTLTRQESDDRIKQILMQYRQKRAAGYQPRKSDVNRTFFGGQELKKKTTLDHLKLEDDRSTPPLSAPIEMRESGSSSEATVLQSPMAHPVSEQDKGKIMKTFKYEVEKLLDF